MHAQAKTWEITPLPASDTVNKIVRRAETVAENFNTEFFNQIRKGGIIILVRPTNDNHRRDTDTPLSSIKNLLQNKIDTKLEKLTKGRNIQYTGKRLVQHQNDIKYSSPKDVLEWESRDLICYKMARRKKYAKSNLSFYMPDTFIGGLFECPISTELKQKIIGNLSNHQILQPLEFQFECDASTARPILPLIADTSINQWIDFKLNPIKPTLFQTIPYLTTASPLNLRFKSSITADMHVDSWASQIHVNEIYDYTIQDVHCISRAIARTADYVNKLLSIDLSKIPLEYGHARSHDHEDSTIPKKSLLLKVESIVGLEEKLYTFIGLLPKNIFEGMMMKMQYLWDDIK